MRGNLLRIDLFVFTLIVSCICPFTKMSELNLLNCTKKVFHWKGKRVTEKMYKKNLKQVALAMELNRKHGKFTSPNPTTNVDEMNINIDDNLENDYGRRIIDLKTLGKNMFCSHCEFLLSLTDLVSEKRIGVASVLYMKCRMCHKITGASTDKQHTVSNGNSHYDSNTQLVIGSMNSGVGNTHISKVFTAMNIPQVNWKNFKTHENEVIQGVESMAQESCLAAAKEERRLTIENYDKLKTMLSPNYQEEFLFPSSSETEIQNKNISDDQIVRVAVSFDMGWFTRGTGRTYDSLSGTGALIGYFSKKVIAYVTLNRKCAKCDRGHSSDDHDCRMNFVGSAKAMEPHAAVVLTKDNPILRACNIEVGIFIGDNDSSSICAVRAANDHEVLKQSDKNHTCKGVVGELYKIGKNFKELTSTTIQYLKKCFNYCVSQNQGHVVNMAKAIKNIPYHAFNHHDDCGNWCSYKSNPENYQHTNIGDGFKDGNLFEALKHIFDNLAQKTSQFVSGASSNPNESLNAMIVSKAPKTRLYSKSPVGDGRVACAISKKNLGEKYVNDLTKNLKMSSGIHRDKFCNDVDLFNEKKYANSLTRVAKSKRVALKKSKTALKNRHEAKEGTTYESNIGLRDFIHESIPIVTIEDCKEPIIVFFDLETGSFSKTSDILQIAAKHEQHEFSVYVKPTQTISEEASKVHGLRLVLGKLELHGKPVITVTLSEALVKFYKFLILLDRRCILAAHNCAFDYPRLMNALGKCFLKQHFHSIISGYCDSLPVIKKKTGKTKKGDNKLENIARELEINNDKAHDALYDVVMLSEVLKKLNITSDDLISSSFTWDDACNKIKFAENLPQALKDLELSKDCVSVGMRKKMIVANVTFEQLEDAYKINKYAGIAQLLGKDENGVVKVIKAKNILDQIFNYFESKEKKIK